MTKSELHKTIADAFTLELKKITSETLKENLHEFSDESGQVSPANMLAFALIKSCELSQNALESVLANVLEFDD